jgi:hypothetical protein
VLAPDLSLVQVGLRRVDRDQRDVVPRALEPHAPIARAERVLEERVADVPCVVVARDEDHVLAGDRLELLFRERVLVGIAVVRQVAGHDHDVRLGRVDLADGRLQQLTAVAGAADVDVR